MLLMHAQMSHYRTVGREPTGERAVVSAAAIPLDLSRSDDPDGSPPHRILLDNRVSRLIRFDFVKAPGSLVGTVLSRFVVGPCDVWDRQHRVQPNDGQTLQDRRVRAGIDLHRRSRGSRAKS